MDWSLVVGITGILVAVVTLALTGEWERVHGLLAVATPGKHKPDIVVGVVVKQDKVLIVHRTPVKGERLHWQFPSGNLRIGEDYRKIVLKEIKQETGVSARVVTEIGQRVHPYSGKRCLYIACDWVEGDPYNADPDENIDARWIAKTEIGAYISNGLFKKVLIYLSK